MVNVLVVNKSTSYCVKLLNSICKENSDIRIANIANNIEDMYKLTSIINFDIILLDFNLLSSSKLDNYVENFIRKYRKSIIIMHNENNIINKFDKLNYVFKYDLNELLNKILKMSSKKTESKIIKNKIKKELDYLGYNPNHLGTNYLAEIIYIIYSTDFEGSLEGKIYPYIAQTHKKTVNTIKCNVVNATALMFCECSNKKFLNYFGTYACMKPGPKTVIYTIINKISA